jgi:DNA-binding NarL/FixJ family response regulator
MPEMNGFEAATVLQKTMPQVPLFMFTHHRCDEVESQAASVGIRAAFSKYTGIDALVAQVSEVLNPAKSDRSSHHESRSGRVATIAVPFASD